MMIKNVYTNKVIVDIKLTKPKLMPNKFIGKMLENALVDAKQGKLTNIVAATQHADGSLKIGYSHDWRVSDALLAIELLNDRTREWVANID